MKIEKIEIRNFRNITRADISFGDINVFTGRNSSGKSNFLLALANILKTKNDYNSEFNGNNVTIGKGRKTTNFKATITGARARTCFLEGNTDKDGTNFFCLEPKQMAFEKGIDKNSFSVYQKLSFTGKHYDNKDHMLKWSDFSKESKIFDNLSVNTTEELVYKKEFLGIEAVGDTHTNIVKTDPVENKHENMYFSVFEGFQNGLVSQIKPTSSNVDLGPITTALSLHRYVTEKGNEQIYQEALKRSRGEIVSPVRAGLENSEFIFLIADIQKNKEVSKKFNKDLDLYTKGIVREISIGPKGALSVISPNGPDGIWTISNGTSVLVFFVSLINWLNLLPNQRSYRLPRILLLDETDSIVHPTILSEFIELLKGLSRKVQIFITTHSPYFLDGFLQEQIYYIKDSASIAEHSVEGVNRCNIYDYKSIINNLSENERTVIENKKNSELFCEGIIDNLFPIKNI